MNTQNKTENDKLVPIVNPQQSVAMSNDSVHSVDVNEYASRTVFLINEVHKRIANAKDLAKSVPDIEGSWFFGWGKHDKQVKVLAQTDLATNDAMTELAKLLQETIAFVTKSTYFARDMCEALAYFAVHGITGANGKIERLSDEAAKSINFIVTQAKNFIQKQESIEQRQSSLEETSRQRDAAIAEFNDNLRKREEESQKQQESLDKLSDQIERNRSKEARERIALAAYFKKEFGGNLEATNQKISELHKMIEERDKAMTKFKWIFAVSFSLLLLILIAVLVLSMR
jgi:ElaB/YqjD/DUF883 family membrane-anchored ribosome-binding protein